MFRPKSIRFLDLSQPTARVPDTLLLLVKSEPNQPPSRQPPRRPPLCPSAVREAPNGQISSSARLSGLPVVRVGTLLASKTENPKPLLGRRWNLLLRKKEAHLLELHESDPKLHGPYTKILIVEFS